MYSSYEDPYKLEEQLEKAELRLQEAKESGDDAAIEDATLEVHELRDRVNFAWQDDEYDAEYAS